MNTNQNGNDNGASSDPVPFIVKYANDIKFNFYKHFEECFPYSVKIDGEPMSWTYIQSRRELINVLSNIVNARIWNSTIRTALSEGWNMSKLKQELYNDNDRLESLCK